MELPELAMELGSCHDWLGLQTMSQEEQFLPAPVMELVSTTEN